MFAVFVVFVVGGGGGLLLQKWLTREAHWHHTAYASWHVPHEGLCSAHCAHWDDDFHVLPHI